jgi:hypothetical protein
MSDFRRLPAITRGTGSRLTSVSAEQTSSLPRGRLVVAHSCEALPSDAKVVVARAVACLRYAFAKAPPESSRASDDAALRFTHTGARSLST